MASQAAIKSGVYDFERSDLGVKRHRSANKVPALLSPGFAEQVPYIPTSSVLRVCS